MRGEYERRGSNSQVYLNQEIGYVQSEGVDLRSERLTSDSIGISEKGWHPGAPVALGLPVPTIVRSPIQESLTNLNLRTTNLPQHDGGVSYRSEVSSTLWST